VVIASLFSGLEKELLQRWGGNHGEKTCQRGDDIRFKNASVSKKRTSIQVRRPAAARGRLKKGETTPNTKEQPWGFFGKRNKGGKNPIWTNSLKTLSVFEKEKRGGRNHNKKEEERRDTHREGEKQLWSQRPSIIGRKNKGIHQKKTNQCFSWWKERRWPKETDMVGRPPGEQNRPPTRISRNTEKDSADHKRIPWEKKQQKERKPDRKE